MSQSLTRNRSASSIAIHTKEQDLAARINLLDEVMRSSGAAESINPADAPRLWCDVTNLATVDHSRVRTNYVGVPASFPFDEKFGAPVYAQIVSPQAPRDHCIRNPAVRAREWNLDTFSDNAFDDRAPREGSF